MDDDPIFAKDEMTYDYSDADTFCIMCGNPDAFFDEQREEYICARCLKRHNERHVDMQAEREAAYAESQLRGVERETLDDQGNWKWSYTLRRR